MRSGQWACAFGLVVWVLAGIAAPAPCSARSGGITATGCNGCHSGGTAPEVRLTAMGEAVPGQPLKLLLEIETVSGPTAGFHMVAEGGGALSSIAGQSTKMLGAGITHSSPKSGSGFVRFEIDWIAPADPTGVLFRVWAVSANDNDRSSGDSAGTTTLSVVSGCEGELYFRDSDRDGYGSEIFGTRLDCSQRDGFTTVDGDCNENDAEINPAANEYCNEQDDDCDGVVDEGSMPQEHFPDPDGDGHGENGSPSVLECPPPPGYAPSDDDCFEGDSAVFPGAEEVCDGQDNDCDNQFDERVRPTCGVGWCRRESASCSADGCLPGEPREEECNAFDDDCDDVLDEGVDCGAGMACEAGYCVVPGNTAGQSGGDGTAGRAGAPVQNPGDAQVPMETDGEITRPTPASSAGGCSALRLGRAARVRSRSLQRRSYGSRDAALALHAIKRCMSASPAIK